MSFYDREILEGLDKIPTPNFPGSLIVTGEAQAVFTGENPGEIILAAYCHGNGKVLVASHDCYLDWLYQSGSSVKENFNRNIKVWLTGENIHHDQIVDFRDAARRSRPFSRYQMIKWHHSFDPSEQDEARLLEWLQSGGGLFCASTPWGYLQIYSGKTLNDMSLHRFLKKYTGIIFTSDVLNLPSEINVSSNRAKHSHFDYCLKRVTENPKKLTKYFSTIDRGIETLNNEGFIETHQINGLRDIVCVSGLNAVPNESRPVKDVNQKIAVKLIGKCLCIVENEKAPGLDDFPGDFNEIPDLLQNVEILINTRFEEWNSTGYYLPAGVTLNVQVESDVEGWSIRIGAHSDYIGDCSSFKRWPSVSITKKLNNNMSFSSPFGGLIYFESSRAGHLKAFLSNVVESPLIDLSKPETIENWINRRNAPGLWAELAGENIIFTTPSYCIRHIENPIDVLQFWDKVVETHHECRGTNVKNYRRERVVNDKQPSAGYMHSGYPIVTHLDCCQKECAECIFDLEKLMINGNWGLFHELGHNMQRNEWTFHGTCEVTVNIFSLHATYRLLGQDILDQYWPRNQMSGFKRYFSGQPTYETFANECGMALMLFAQLIKHFGWSSMYQFMKNYEADISSGLNLPHSEQDKIDQWVLRYSKIVSRNIKPQFEMFGLPVSHSVDSELSDLEPWCPTEEKDGNIFFTKLN